MKGSFVVYVLRNPRGLRYIGMTSDLSKRIAAHEAGLSIFTSSRGPWEVVWKSHDLDHSSALLLEKKMKRQKGGQGLQRFMNLYGRDS